MVLVVVFTFLDKGARPAVSSACRLLYSVSLNPLCLTHMVLDFPKYQPDIIPDAYNALRMLRAPKVTLTCAERHEFRSCMQALDERVDEYELQVELLSGVVGTFTPATARHVTQFRASAWYSGAIACDQLSVLVLGSRVSGSSTVWGWLGSLRSLRHLDVQTFCRPAVLDALVTVAPRLEVLCLEFISTADTHVFGAADIPEKLQTLSRSLTRCRTLKLAMDVAEGVAILHHAPVVEEVCLGIEAGGLAEALTEQKIRFVSSTIRSLSLSCMFIRTGLSYAIVDATSASHAAMRVLCLRNVDTDENDCSLLAPLAQWASLTHIETTCNDSAVFCENTRRGCMHHHWDSVGWQLPRSLAKVAVSRHVRVPSHIAEHQLSRLPSPPSPIAPSPIAPSPRATP